MIRIDKYVRQGFEWPLNIVFTLFEFAGEPIPAQKELPPDLERTLMFILQGIKRDRADILLRYYQGKMTTYEIADELGTSHQDAAYDLRTALECIARSTRNMTLIRHGVIACLNRRIKEAYSAGYVDGYYIGFKDGENGSKPEHDVLSIEAMDLSVRATNCLLRAQFSTAEEVACADSLRIAKIRNLGHKAAEEVYFKLKELGLDPKWDMVSFSKATAEINREKYYAKKKE